MKTIYLVRHGKAVNRETGLPDFERALIKRGQKETVEVAAILHENGIRPEVIISSPAERALATAKILASQFKYRQKKIRTRKAIYDQAASALLNAVQEIDDDYGCVLLVGHDPALTDFVRFLVPGFQKDIPTSAVVGVDCPVDTWQEVTQGRGRLKLFLFPGSNLKLSEDKSYRKDLEKKLAERIAGVLGEEDAPAAKEMQKSIRKASRELVRRFIAERR